MDQKRFVNVVLFVVVILVLGATGYFIFVKKSESEPVTEQLTPNSSHTPTLRPNFSSFETKKENGRMVLYGVYADGISEKTGLEVDLFKAGTYEVPVNIVVSPDKIKATFNKWNNTISKSEIYVSSIDGTNAKLLTQQEVGDGSGGLNQDSLTWLSDGKYITYFELHLACEGECEPGSIVSYKTTYQVNVVTGEKKIISKVPDQYE